MMVAAQYVLLVEPNASLHKLLAMLFYREGYHVVCVRDGAQATKTLAELRVHAIVVNTASSIIEPEQLLWSIQDCQARVPIIVVKSNRQWAVRHRAINSDIFACIELPMRLGTLFATLKAALAYDGSAKPLRPLSHPSPA